MDKVEFVKFGTRPRDNHLYALDDKNIIWVSISSDEWESLEEVPRRIKQGLNDFQLWQVMGLNKRRR